MSAFTLKPRQLHALQLLAMGRPIVEVAAVVEVSTMTIFRWKSHPAFRARLELATNSGMAEIVKKVNATALTAIETLQETLCDMTQPVQLRVKVALGVLGVLGAMGPINAALNKRMCDGVADFDVGTRFDGPAYSYDGEGKLIPPGMSDAVSAGSVI